MKKKLPGLKHFSKGPNDSPSLGPRLVEFGKKTALWIRQKWLLFLLVIMPTVFGIVYFGFIASDLYISESQFLIRQPDKKNLSSLGQLLQSTGMTSSHDDVYTIKAFMLSRDALKLIDDNMKLRKIYSNKNIDFLNRFDNLGGDNSFEAFFKYYEDIVTLDIDTASSVCLLKVRAYTPQTAYDINNALLFLGEGMVNALNDRAKHDFIQFAKQEVDEAELTAKEKSMALAGYRNRQILFDPAQESSMQLQQVAKLQSDLIDVRGQLAQLRTFAAESPYIKALEKRASNLQKEITTEMSKVAGGSGSMTQKSTEYERLMLDREFANKRLLAALSSLQEARAQAGRQQLYLEKIVLPSMPDRTFYPRRIRNIFLIFLSGLLVYGIVKLLIVGVEEHNS